MNGIAFRLYSDIGNRIMDLSLLYLMFPRLSERRFAVGNKVCLDKAPIRLLLMNTLPSKRDRQLIRISRSDKRHIINAKESLRVEGVDADGTIVDFVWKGTGRHGADFVCSSKTRIQYIAVSSTQQQVVKISWIDAARTSK